MPPEYANLPPRITSAEAAAILRVTPKTMAKRRARKIAPLPVGGSTRRLLYDRDEVLRSAGFVAT